MNDRLLTTREVATRLNRHIYTVQLAIRTGKLPARRAGGTGQFLVSERDLEAYLKPVKAA